MRLNDVSFKALSGNQIFKYMYIFPSSIPQRVQTLHTAYSVWFFFFLNLVKTGYLYSADDEAFDVMQILLLD